jgi:hypothetical protein
MALPLIAAGIAARAVAKKLATRAAGGITGTGAKQVNPVYRNTGSVKIVKGIDTEAKQLGMSKKQWQKVANKESSVMAKSNKSGYSAKEAAGLRNWENTFVNTKKPTVKINSNPMRGK